MCLDSTSILHCRSPLSSHSVRIDTSARCNENQALKCIDPTHTYHADVLVACCLCAHSHRHANARFMCLRLCVQMEVIVQAGLDVTPELTKEMQDYFVTWERNLRHKSTTRCGAYFTLENDDTVMLYGYIFLDTMSKSSMLWPRVNRQVGATGSCSKSQSEANLHKCEICKLQVS